MAKKIVLVTGGAGFIGSHLVDRLLELGYKVTVIDNFSTGKQENLKGKKIKLIKKDICENLDPLFKKGKFTTVFHLAAIPRVQLSIKNPITTHRSNIDGTFNLLMAAKNHGVKRFIFSSSSSVYGDQSTLPLVETMTPNPLSPYALHKLVGEYYCHLFHRLYDIETISLRYFNVFGPRQSPNSSYANLIPGFFDKLSRNEVPVIYGDGKNTRDYTFVDDVVAANILAAGCRDHRCFGQVFNIGSGKSHSILQVASAIIKLTGASVRPVHGPAVIEPKNTLADTSKAKRLLGWKPTVNFTKGMKKAAAHILQ